MIMKCGGTEYKGLTRGKEPRGSPALTPHPESLWGTPPFKLVEISETNQINQHRPTRTNQNGTFTRMVRLANTMIELFLTDAIKWSHDLPDPCVSGGSAGTHAQVWLSRKPTFVEMREPLWRSVLITNANSQWWVLDHAYSQTLACWFSKWVSNKIENKGSRDSTKIAV